MDFYEVLAKIIDILQREGRTSYRALKRQFDLDDEYLEDLKVELIEVRELATDRDNKMLVWTGETKTPTVTTSQPDQAAPQSTAQKEPPIQVEPLPESYTPEAERRQLTILFTDLVDSTKLSSELDAENYREVVRAYQATCAEVIERFDCNLAQTLGDGLLIYSGYPVAHENDAERAVRAGLGILNAMKALNERLEQEKGIRLGIRVGIHSGIVVVGDVGAGSRHEQLALGEVPNVAARIQGLAVPDTVVISDATYRLIQGYFDCETLGERELRGVAEPLSLYRVLGDSGVQSRLDVASTRGLTPLVGREQEVGLLIERWQQVKAGQGQVILLSGEGGIGKSRLIQVLKDHIADEPHTRLECRSSPYFTNSALYPIIDMMQRTLQFQADDAPERRLGKLEQELGHYRLPLEETVPLFAPLLSLEVPEEQYPPLNLSPQRQRQKTLASIVTLLLELAERQPVLFILEDAHWLDASTQEVLALLIDQVPTSPILTLITYRPEFQPTWGNRSYLSQLTLNRLSQNQIERMAEQVAGAKRLPAEIVQQLVDKTDGVPLYVEEMTKAVVESGVLKEVNGQYELTGPLSTLAIPATLQDSLMARLDRLVTAKAVAQYAAVIGRQFSYELLQAVSQLDEATLQRELSRLVEAELVYQRGLPPQSTYVFKHALIVEASYQSLLRSTRQGYHRRIAEVLEQRFPESAENQPELLAHHFSGAGLNEQAVEYWKQAGERAGERSANMEAIAHLSTGLELLKTLPDNPARDQQELDILTLLGPVFMRVKGYAATEVIDTYTRARELCAHLGDRRQTLVVLLQLTSLDFVRAHHRQSLELAKQCFTMAERLHEPMLRLEAQRRLGGSLSLQGDLCAAREHLEQALNLYQPDTQHGHRAVQDFRIACLSFLAWTLAPLGHLDEALACMRRASKLAQDLSHPFSLVFAVSHTMYVHQFRREPHGVQQCAEETVRIAREHGFPLFLGFGLIMHGWALAVQDQIAKGIAQLHQGLETYRLTGQQNFCPYYLSLLAEAYGKKGQTEQGLGTLADAFTLAADHEEPYYEAELHRLKGTLLLQQSADNHTEAEACFQKAIAIAQNQSAKSWELRAVTSLAKLWQQQDKHKEAYDLLAPVYGWFTEGFDTADLIDAKTLLDELSEGR